MLSQGAPGAGASKRAKHAGAETSTDKDMSLSKAGLNTYDSTQYNPSATTERSHRNDKRNLEGMQQIIVDQIPKLSVSAFESGL